MHVGTATIQDKAQLAVLLADEECADLLPASAPQPEDAASNSVFHELDVSLTISCEHLVAIQRRRPTYPPLRLDVFPTPQEAAPAPLIISPKGPPASRSTSGR